jgi:amidophosphoribosyltransferase
MCGLFGIFGSPEAVELTYLGLFALQHRGQESAGIAAVQGTKLIYHKGMGLVADVFSKELLDSMRSTSAIGHVRYSTTGISSITNAQPLVVNSLRGMIAIAHNGNLTNSSWLRKEFEGKGSIFQTTMDSEIFLHLLAQPDIASDPDGLIKCLSKVAGSYSLLLITPRELIAVRDPHGFRPLCLGCLPGLFPAYAVASESCAFDLTGIKYIREIKPGEILYINQDGLRSQFMPPARHSYCIFEHVYFARPDSLIYGDTVHEVRKRLGKTLAKQHPVKADLVTAIPDSGNSTAIGYAEEAGIPFDSGFIRNHYVGRTFIQPSQGQRDIGVEIKLNVVKDVVAGKRIVVVDDSIIRGTTSQSRIRILRDAGAKEIHMRISCPPVIAPCFYGIDFPTKRELIAANRGIDEIARHLGLDSLGYLSLDGLLGAVSNPPDCYCDACYTERYPIPIEGELDKLAFEPR